MDFELTPQQKHIQVQAREFAEQEVAPVAREADEKGEFPMHLVKRMGELGFLAGPIEPEYGGGALGYLGYAPPPRGPGGGEFSPRGFFSRHTNPGVTFFPRFGNEQRERRQP